MKIVDLIRNLLQFDGDQEFFHESTDGIFAPLIIKQDDMGRVRMRVPGFGYVKRAAEPQVGEVRMPGADGMNDGMNVNFDGDPWEPFNDGRQEARPAPPPIVHMPQAPIAAGPKKVAPVRVVFDEIQRGVRVGEFKADRRLFERNPGENDQQFQDRLARVVGLQKVNKVPRW